MKQVACVLLAAGNGTRLGGNKLLLPVDGEPMIARAAGLHAALPYAVRVIVLRENDAACRQYINAAAFVRVGNPAPERGISGSVRLGLEAAAAAAETRGIVLDGVLFSVCDQPRLRRETVERMLKSFCAAPDRIVAPVSGDGRRGNPVIFPKTLFSELLAVTGDRGGGTVLARHPELLLPCAADAAELFDIDTPADAAAAGTVLARRNPI